MRSVESYPISMRGFFATVRRQMCAFRWTDVLLRDPCVYCVATSTSIDHIHPRIHGGANGWENLAPACKGCNEMKGEGSLMWMLWRLQERRCGRVRRRVIGHRIGRGGRRVPIRSLREYQGMLRKPSPPDAADRTPGATP